MAATAHLTLVAPDNEKCTVRSAPARLLRRKPNAEYRSREHLTQREVERLIETVKGNRQRNRDTGLIACPNLFAVEVTAVGDGIEPDC